MGERNGEGPEGRAIVGEWEMSLGKGRSPVGGSAWTL